MKTNDEPGGDRRGAVADRRLRQPPHRRTSCRPSRASTTRDRRRSGDQDGNVTGTPVPGSRGDFLQSVGQYGDRVLFDFDSYALDAEDRATLDAQAAWLARNPTVRVTIEGHADERGTREYNLALGDRRANAARDYLAVARRRAGPDAGDQLGQGAPGRPGSNEAAWAQNRRAVTVVPE